MMRPTPVHPVLYSLLAALVAPASLAAPVTPAAVVLAIHYTIAMPDPASHLFDVTLDIERVRDSVVKLQMPVWSPGRYARMDFAKNVQDFSVRDAAGRPVRWDRENGSLWRIYPAGVRRVVVHYRVFGDNLSGTFSVLDTLHANWNGASVFMYVAGHKPDAVTLRIQPPAGWHILNGDTRTPDQASYTFENYDRLIDTPTEVAPAFSVDSFNVDGRLYRVMLHNNGPVDPAARQRFVDAVRRIVVSHNRVVAPPPLQMYTFLFNAGFGGRDGMEHLYSTEIVVRHPFADSAGVAGLLDDAAHEYFHTWNVKRIRPLPLGPFDYTHEQYEPSLWVAEGWTQYYGEMAVSRAALGDRPALNARIGGLVQANLTAPGRRETSARMASFEAPFFDGAASPQKTNSPRSFFSYYSKGGGLALALDIMIRDRSNSTRSLDDALRTLKRLSWDQPNASYYLQGRGYTEGDVEHAVSQAMGTDMHAWFQRYVAGTEDLPFDDILALAGLRLDRTGKSWTLADLPNATEHQRTVRAGWLAGTTSR